MNENLPIHKDIKKRLKHFLNDNDIPNIIFYGPSGNGKHTLVKEFVNKIYKNDMNLFNDYVLNVNCAHGKGIKFIREDFCGTFSLCCEWVKAHHENRACGIDLDLEPIEYGKKNYYKNFLRNKKIG